MRVFRFVMAFRTLITPLGSPKFIKKLTEGAVEYSMVCYKACMFGKPLNAHRSVRLSHMTRTSVFNISRRMVPSIVPALM